MNLMNDFINENEDVELIGFDFTNSDLQGMSFKGANLETAIFENVNLEHVNFVGANLKNANLKNANLEGANLCGANMEGADFRRAKLKWVNMDGGILSNALFNRANMRNTNLSNTFCHRANFTGANMTYCVLENAFCEEAILKSANLRGSILKNTNFRNANLTNANTIDTNLYGIILDGATHNIYSIETQRLLEKITSSAIIPMATIRMVNTFDKENVLDFVDGEISIDEISDKDVIFYIKNQKQGITYPRSNLQQAYNDRSSIFVSCSKNSASAVNILNLKPNRIFFRINLTITVFVSIDSIKLLLLSKQKEWYIKRTDEEEEFIASIEVVYDRGELNIFGEELNIVSKDHCQAGTNQKICELSPVEFIVSGGSYKQTRKFRRCKKCKTKKKK